MPPGGELLFVLSAAGDNTYPPSVGLLFSLSNKLPASETGPARRPVSPSHRFALMAELMLST